MRITLLFPLCIWVLGCATTSPPGERTVVERGTPDQRQNPFLHLRKGPRVSQEQAIEIACAAMRTKNVAATPATAEAFLATHQGRPIWHVGHREGFGRGWQVMVNASSGKVLFAEILRRK